MNKLSEEEKDIEYLEKYINWETYGERSLEKAIKTILDLYKAEKEKNKWKPISEYDRQKYDWVLVKYFDGNYECVPEVAEMRFNGKWYTTEREIPFEVKYFFDMQELLDVEE